MPTPAPRSSATTQALSNLWDTYWYEPAMVTVVLIIAGLGISFLTFVATARERSSSSTPYAFIWGTVLLLIMITWMTVRLIRGRAYRRDQAFILEENERDYDASLRLQVVLDGFNRTPVSTYSITEPMQAGDWRVFRVEHFMGSNAHAMFAGSLGFYGFTVQGKLSWHHVPNLLDASTILFLQKGDETMRAILPSPSGVRELVTQTLSHWFANRRSGSHVDQALWAFKMKDDVLLKPISHPVFIDRLDVACGSPAADRPTIRVAGQLIQPGVMLVSALQLDDRDAIFLPSGLFHRLGDALSPYIGPVEQPKLITAIS